MDLGLLLDNLLSPPIMFFALGVAAGLVKSDLAIPEAVTKLLSLYLLWSIGLKGGVQLRAGEWSSEVVTSLLAAFGLATVIPLLVFVFLRPRLGADNAGALAAVYGSVSAVTFLTACAHLNRDGIPFGGHMVAALAVMESPAIIIAVLLVRRSHALARDNLGPRAPSLAESLREAALNGPVVLLTGSMAIGAAIGENGFKPLAPLAASLFPGVLAFFLLELGLLAAKKSRALKVVGPSLIAFGLVVPLLGAAAAAGLARTLSLAPGNAFLLIVLASSASYIAAPAAARTAIPRASPGLYVPLALAVTFPFNIAFGIPLYWQVVRLLWKDVN